MDFELSEDLRMMRETAARFTQKNYSARTTAIRREAERGFDDTALLPPELEAELIAKARAVGLAGIEVPEEFAERASGRSRSVWWSSS